MILRGGHAHLNCMTQAMPVPACPHRKGSGMEGDGLLFYVFEKHELSSFVGGGQGVASTAGLGASLLLHCHL